MDGIGLRSAAALLLAASCALAGGRNPLRVPAGDWGGDHIRLTVTDEGGTFELDCAHGSIDEPLALDASARFDAKGVFVREHGGPIRRDEAEQREPARYRGTLSGDSLSLSIRLDSGEEIGSFRLERGKPGRVVKCR